MKKVSVTLLIVGVIFLVGCVNSHKKHTDNSVVQTSTMKEISSQKTTDELTTEQSTTKASATEESSSDQSISSVEVREEQVIDPAVYVPNGKTPQLMKDVLLSKVEFTFVETEWGTTDKIATYSMLLSKYNYWVDSFSDVIVEIYDYRVIDLDGDGYNEVILELTGNNDLILHYEDNTVYGFMYYDRSMNRIYTSGIFIGSSGASSSMYSTISFDTETYEITDLVGWDWDTCYIEGKEATDEEVIEYMDNDKFTYVIPRYKDVESILNME